jgi:hypothetical protein
MNAHNERHAPLSPEHQRAREVVDLAMKGDTSVIGELRQLLADEPLLRRTGDLVMHTEENLIHAYSAASSAKVLLAEAIRAKVAELRRELVPTTPIERLLVDRIVISQLQLSIADQDFECLNGDVMAVESRRRRLDSANTRYLRSLKALANVRRLLGRPRSPKAAPTGGSSAPSRSRD